MEKRENICSICGKSKTPDESGRVSQFISTCVCSLEKPEASDSKQISICQDCGKKIDTGRVGSMTQFVLRQELCQCNTPNPRDLPETNPSDNSNGPVFSGYREEDIEAEDLEIEEDAFPFDRYQPLKLLGAGSSGQVYLAKDKLLKKNVAVKVLQVLTNEQLVSFQEEAKTTSKLDHPSIVSILDFGATESGTPFMALEYFPGRTLDNIIKEEGGLDWKTCQLVFTEICQALSYAHNQGIFHRDLKPSNILLNLNSSNEIQVRLIDFGLAKVSELTGKTTEFQGKTLVGTPYYMSPDSAKGLSYSVQSEIYSLGCILFESLTGSPPFKGETALETLSMHAKDSVPELSSLTDEDLPDAVQTTVGNCLHKSPDDRYSSVDELYQALAEIQKPVERIKEEPILQSTGSIKVQEFKSTSRIKSIWLVVAACLLVVPVLLIAKIAFTDNTTAMLSNPEETGDKNVHNTMFRFDDEKSIKILPELENRVFSEKSVVINRNITDKELMEEKIPEKTTALSITSDKITGSGFKNLPRLHLKHVELTCPNFTEEGARYLAKMLSLAEVDMKNASNFPLSGYRALSKAPNLNRIHLKKTTIPKFALREIAKIKNLSSLVLSDCALEDDTDFQYLEDARSLAFLRFAYTDISATGYNAMTKINPLRAISISAADFDKNQIKGLSKVKTESIRFTACTVPDEAFLQLTKSRYLRRIYLRSVNSTSKFCYKTFREARPDILLDTNANSATINQLRKDINRNDELRRANAKWSTN